MEKAESIWMNGEFVPWADARIHVLSHGLHYGSGVFEGERAYGGVIFKLDEHLDRIAELAEPDLQLLTDLLAELDTLTGPQPAR